MTQNVNFNYFPPLEEAAHGPAYSHLCPKGLCLNENSEISARK